MDNTLKGIYIDLDSIFDTRLGVIGEIDPKLIKEVFNEKYLFRKSDTFGIMQKKTFDELYSVRDYNTLKISPYTAIFSVVNDIINKLLETAVGVPDVTGVKLYVNIFPYKLSNSFIGDLLEFIVQKTKQLVIVEIIDKSIDDLTFSYCVDKFDFLIMYDYNAFLESNVKKLEHKKNSLNDRILICPPIFYKEFTKQEMDSLHRKNPALSGKSPIDLLKIMAAPVIILEMIEVMAFSVDITLLNGKQNTVETDNSVTEDTNDKIVNDGPIITEDDFQT